MIVLIALFWSCVFVGLVCLFCVMFVQLAKRVDEQIAKSKPFSHLPEHIRQMCDNFDVYTIESIISAAEHEIANPARPQWITVPKNEPLPYLPGGALPCVHCAELTYRMAANGSAVCYGC